MISYDFDSITITDDHDPARAPLILPASSTPTDVEAAIATYLQPEPEPEPPADPLATLTPEQKAALLALLQQNA